MHPFSSSELPPAVDVTCLSRLTYHPRSEEPVALELALSARQEQGTQGPPGESLEVEKMGDRGVISGLGTLPQVPLIRALSSPCEQGDLSEHNC